MFVQVTRGLDDPSLHTWIFCRIGGECVEQPAVGSLPFHETRRSWFGWLCWSRVGRPHRPVRADPALQLRGCCVAPQVYFSARHAVARATTGGQAEKAKLVGKRVPVTLRFRKEVQSSLATDSYVAAKVIYLWSDSRALVTKDWSDSSHFTPWERLPCDCWAYLTPCVPQVSVIDSPV